MSGSSSEDFGGATSGGARTRARVAALVVEVTGWIIMVGGVVGGLDLVVTASSYVNESQARLSGLATVAGSIVFGAWTIMTAAYVQSRTRRS